MFNILKDVVDNSPAKPDAAKFGTLSSVLAFGANVAIIIALAVSLGGLAWSFIQFLLSQGDPKSVQKAYSGLYWSIIALVLSVSAFAIKNIFFKLFGAWDNLW